MVAVVRLEKNKEKKRMKGIRLPIGQQTLK